MTGYEYEEKCAQLLRSMGYTNVKVTPGSGDQGIDIIAHSNGKKYGIQCKYYESTVGNKAVQEAFSGAAYYDCDVAMVITNSRLTSPAKTLASKLNVQVMEGVDAVYLMKHDKEYLEKKRQEEEEIEKMWEEIRREKEEEEKRLTAEFQKNALALLPQWKKQYKDTVQPLLKSTRRELEQLEQKTRQELANCDQKLEEAEKQKQAWITESNTLRSTLSSHSIFTYIFRPKIINPLQERLTELQTAIDNFPNDILAAQKAHREAVTDLKRNQHKAENNLVNTVIASFPEPSGDLYRIYKYLLWREAMKCEHVQTELEQTVNESSEKRDAMQRKEGMKQYVWLEFCSRKLRLSPLEFPQHIPELNNHYDISPPEIANHLKCNGMLQEVTQNPPVYYEADDLIRYISIYEKVCAALAVYTETDLNFAIDSYMQHSKITSAHEYLKKCHRKICESVQSMTRPHAAPDRNSIESHMKKFHTNYYYSNDYIRYLRFNEFLIKIWDCELTEREYQRKYGYSSYMSDRDSYIRYVHWKDYYEHPSADYWKSECT